jgi:hypothetical protein
MKLTYEGLHRMHLPHTALGACGEVPLALWELARGVVDVAVLQEL